MAVQAVAVGSLMHSFTDVKSDIAVAYDKYYHEKSQNNQIKMSTKT